MVNTVPRNLKEIHNYPAEGKVTNTERNHGLSGRFPGIVNVNIGPVHGLSHMHYRWWIEIKLITIISSLDYIAMSLFTFIIVF